MPTDLETLMSGNVSGREVTAAGSAERTPTGRMVQDRDYLTKLLEVHKYRGKHIDTIILDMTVLEDRVMANMMDPPTMRALKALNEGRTIVVAVKLLEKVALLMECMNPGKLFEELVHVDMDEIEQKFLVTLVKKGKCPAQKPKGAHGIAKWEMPLRNHETNHLGKGPRNKFGGFN